MAAPNPKNCLLTWDKKRLSHTLLGISMEQRTSRWVLTLTLHRSEISVFERCSYVVTEGCCYVMPDVVLAKLNNFTSLGVVENANFSRALYVIQGVVSQLMRVRWDYHCLGCFVASQGKGQMTSSLGPPARTCT